MSTALAMSPDRQVGNVLPLRELESPDYSFVQFDDDVQSVVEGCGESVSNASGAVVKPGNGFFEEVWITTEGRPFERSASYVRVA